MTKARAKRAWGDSVPNRDEQFELKRQVVLRTAARTYSQRGFYETTLADIADELNISKPTLYYYFKSKDDILFECHRIGIDAIINGDEGGNLDNAASSKTHFGKACPAAGSDSRTVWDGLRSMANDNAASPATEVDGSAGLLTAALINEVCAAMGEYGADSAKLAVITSSSGVTRLRGDANFLTKDKMGDLATLLTGSIGKVWDIPITLSRRYPRNLGDVGALHKIGSAGDTDLTGAIVVRRDLAVLGNRRRITMDMDKHVAAMAKLVKQYERARGIDTLRSIKS